MCALRFVCCFFTHWIQVISISALRESVLPFFPCVRRIYLFVCFFLLLLLLYLVQWPLPVAVPIDKCINSLKIVCEAHSMHLKQLQMSHFSHTHKNGRTATTMSSWNSVFFSFVSVCCSLALTRLAVVFFPLHLLCLCIARIRCNLNDRIYAIKSIGSQLQTISADSFWIDNAECWIR